MADNPTYPARTPSRKPQINLEVTDEEKVFFGQLADARGVKLAALVRELLNEEGRRLGIPALLETYKSQNTRYQYLVKADEKSELKLGIFRQFLQAFKADCDFSITGYEPETYSASIQCTAYSSSGESSNTIYVGLAVDKATNYKEREEIDRAWLNILGLSLNLADKWDGVNFVVEKRRTLKGKQILLKQFVEKYRASDFQVNDSYNGGTVFRIVATTGQEKTALLIEYLPQRIGEAAELREALQEYQRQVSQQH